MNSPQRDALAPEEICILAGQIRVSPLHSHLPLTATACDPHGDLLKKVKLKEATFFFAHQNFAWVNIGHQ